MKLAAVAAALVIFVAAPVFADNDTNDGWSRDPGKAPTNSTRAWFKEYCEAVGCGTVVADLTDD